MISEGAGRRAVEDAGSAVAALEQSRGWWAGLPDQLCNELAAKDVNYCWNGAKLAP